MPLKILHIERSIRHFLEELSGKIGLGKYQHAIDINFADWKSATLEQGIKTMTTMSWVLFHNLMQTHTSLYDKAAILEAINLCFNFILT